jgi:outer membrane protein assembly factor BamB
MRISIVAAVAGCSLALLTGGSASALTTSSDWSQNGGGAARHASNPAEHVLGRGNVSGLRLQPTSFADDCPCGMIRPIVSGGVVYTQNHVTGGSAIEAWDEHTGAFVWATQPFSLTNNFAISDGVLVASDFITANLYGFSTADGSLLWTAAAGNSDVQPVIANSVVYVDHGFIQALDLHTGAIIWNGPAIGTDGHSGPAVWDNEVFQYDVNGYIHAFDTSDGHQLWSTQCNNPGWDGAIDRSPMVLNGVVYDGASCAIDALTGVPVRPNTSLLSVTSDATGGVRMFTGYRFGNSHGNFVRAEALDPKTGATLWHHDLLEGNLWSQPLGQGPVVANGVVYFADSSASTDLNAPTTVIRAYNTKTGAELWHSKQFNGQIWGISVADGRLWALIGTTVRSFAVQ